MLRWYMCSVTCDFSEYYQTNILKNTLGWVLLYISLYHQLQDNKPAFFNWVSYIFVSFNFFLIREVLLFLTYNNVTNLPYLQRLWDLFRTVCSLEKCTLIIAKQHSSFGQLDSITSSKQHVHRDMEQPYLAQFCAEKKHTKISCEHSAIKRCLRCQDIPRIQKISDARSVVFSR